MHNYCSHIRSPLSKNWIQQIMSSIFNQTVCKSIIVFIKTHEYLLFMALLQRMKQNKFPSRFKLSNRASVSMWTQFYIAKSRPIISWTVKVENRLIFLIHDIWLSSLSSKLINITYKVC